MAGDACIAPAAERQPEQGVGHNRGLLQEALEALLVQSRVAQYLGEEPGAIVSPE